MSRLHAHSATISYPGGETICHGITTAIPDKKFTVIVGPNACGKSTLLKALSRLLKPESGEIILDGKDIHHHPTRAVAMALGLLPQSPHAPEGIRVADLVARGRYPHQKLFQAWSDKDEEAVAHAMELTRTAHLSGMSVDDLSGGQRQRVWMAVVLAQQTPIMLLDEPTTYLDIANQVELLELCRRLNRVDGHTIVAVLHDLNQACRYADHIIAMKEGHIVTEGPVSETITEDLVGDIFGLSARVIDDPESHTPLVIPSWDH